MKKKCGRCGACCTDILPVTDIEIEVLRAYAKEKQIEDTRINVDKCPFWNARKRRCNVYDVRPLACRLYDCRKDEEVLASEFERMRESDRRPQSIRGRIFYDRPMPIEKTVLL